MNSCKYLWLKVFYSSPSIFLFFFVLFLADGINANAASAAEHEHRLAAEIASLKEKFMDDCLVDSIYPCNLAPTPLDERVCLMRLHWNKEVEKLFKTNGFRKHLPPISPLFVLNIEEQTPSVAEAHYSCMDLMCLCPLVNGTIEATTDESDKVDQNCKLGDGSIFQKATRKEYRQLTKEERTALHKAFNDIKKGGVQEFDRFVLMHERPSAPSAHGGPAFLPWHREYLKRMEIALRRVNPSVALAYWDVTLDAPLENPRDSILWSSEFLGDIDEHGVIKDGKFSDWTDANNNRLTRTLNGGDLIDRKTFEQWMEAGELAMYSMELCKPECVNKDGSNDGPTSGSLEHKHDYVHMFVGGTMSNPTTAPNDPTFYFYHTYIDYIWEKWRQERESRKEQESVYPEEFIQCCKPAHLPHSVHSKDYDMKPFNETGPIKIIDGLSIKYTHPETGLFRYADRPKCSAEQDCNSDYLFCHRDAGTSNCVSKITPGGKCEKFQENVENPCYNGTCENGICRGSINTHEDIPQTTNEIFAARKNITVYAKGLGYPTICTENHECCWFWFKAGLCHQKARHMNSWCPGICQRNGCAPHWYRIGREDEDKYCDDAYEHCEDWIGMKPEECVLNPFWTSQNCRKSCGRCHLNRRDACRGKLPDDI